MLVLVELHSSVDVVHPVAQHAIYQSGQLGGHGFDGGRSPQLRSQAAELRSQIGLVVSQGARRHFESDGYPVVGGEPTLANDPVATNSIIRTEPQPGDKMVLGLP